MVFQQTRLCENITGNLTTPSHLFFPRPIRRSSKDNFLLGSFEQVFLVLRHRDSIAREISAFRMYIEKF